jgi:hypothetical protein
MVQASTYDAASSGLTPKSRIDFYACFEPSSRSSALFLLVKHSGDEIVSQHFIATYSPRNPTVVHALLLKNDRYRLPVNLRLQIFLEKTRYSRHHVTSF